jgi:hypothetical protein
LALLQEILPREWNPLTLRSNVDRIKAGTPQGVLLELARLTQGKIHLRGEEGR